MSNICTQHLIQLLQKHYGLIVQHVERLPFGADINAEVFKASDSKQSYFVKVKHEVQEDVGLKVLKILHDAGVREIILPLHAENPQLLVYPFVDAHNGFVQPLSPQQWQKLGAALRRIHEVTIPIELQTQLRSESFSNHWRKKVHDICDSIHKTNATLISYTESILSLLEKAESFSLKINNDKSGYVLCHADIHAGNVLLLGEESLYIVDWDNPIMAPKERDLMFVGAGVGNVWNNPEEADFFYEGYGATSIDDDLIAFYRCERILEDFAIYAEAILSQEKSADDKLKMFQYLKDMFDKNGVVEIALS